MYIIIYTNGIFCSIIKIINYQLFIKFYIIDIMHFVNLNTIIIIIISTY